MTNVYKISKALTCHCWNQDCTQIAVSLRNSNDILIYGNCQAATFKDWKLIHTLKGHDLPVTGIDWDYHHNRLLSCSEDCNAYVWTYENEEWIPTLVVLKIKRAALCCKWSPDGTMFAVGSSEKKLRICSFNKDQNLWVHPTGLPVRQEKEEEEEGDTPTSSGKTRGSIFSICWDRTGQLLCRGSLDGTMSVVCTYFDPNKAIMPCPFDIRNKDVFGFVFGDKVGAVEGLAVNLANTAIAYSDRNSDLHVLEFVGFKMSKQTVHIPTLPLPSILFITDTILVGGGYDGNLHILTKNDGEWKYYGVADTSSTSMKSTSFNDRIKLFQSSSSNRGIASSLSTVATKGPHTNQIMELQVMKVDASHVSTISSCGLDGRIVEWDMDKILKQMQLV